MTKTVAFGAFCCCFLAFSVFSLPLPAQDAFPETAEDVVCKVFAARGGLDKIRAINSQRISGHIFFGDVSGPFVVELKRPLEMHMQLTVQNMTMLRVYDGKSAGWANNPFAGKMNPDSMTPDELANISEESDFDGPLVDYQAKGNHVELMGKDKVKEQEAWRLKLTTKSGDVRYYLFDADSFLLLKWEGQRTYEGKQFPVESYFSDYRDIDGMKFAFEIDSGASATDITQKISIERLELNPQISDSEFTKPTLPASSAPAEAPSASPAPATSPAAPDSAPAEGSKPAESKPPADALYSNAASSRPAMTSRNVADNRAASAALGTANCAIMNELR